MKRKPIQTSEELVRAFADLFDEVDPDAPEDVDEMLRVTGHDPDEVAAKMKATAEQAFADAMQHWQQQTMDKLEEERAQLARFESTSDLGRTDIIRAIRNLSAHFGGQVVLAHRNLEGETDESLASLLRHLQYLASQQGNEEEDQNAVS
jgi:hypothetical protein